MFIDILPYLKRNLFLSCARIFFFIILFFAANAVFANPISHLGKFKKMTFTPPPIPVVNTPEMKAYVNQYHTFPSPFGYEPYRDKNGKPLTFLIKVLNKRAPYIPVTIYCNSDYNCPESLLITQEGLVFEYSNRAYHILKLKGMPANQMLNAMSFYFPNNPTLYTAKNIARPPRFYFPPNVRKGEPLVTILFSQLILRILSEYDEGGKLKGYFSVNDKENFSENDNDILLPTADGNESIAVGTTLSLIGLGEASGVEFTESIAQTTGESYTKQIQTGFSIDTSIENQITLGGGEVPVSDGFKIGINYTLSGMVNNATTVANQQTLTRSYTIKPGIEDIYYWAIYQLLYSYRVQAPLLENVFSKIQLLFQDTITFKIGDNDITRDGKPIGVTLPPQAPYLANDIAVGVAIPVNGNNNSNTNKNPDIFAQVF